jgi:hypothetical protein
VTAPLSPPAGALLVGTSTGRVGTMRTKNGRYHDGERSYQRTSNLLKNIETDTFNLDEWRGNMLAIGLSMRSDLVLGVAAAAQFDPVTGKLTQEAKSTLRGLRKQATDAAKSKAGANTGTAVHTATERLDLGETVEQIGLPAPYDADLRAYETLKRAMRLSYRPEHIERTVRNLTTDNCGSFDRLGSCELLVERGVLAPGELLVVDVKTEGDPLKNMIHIGPQLADYAFADDMFVPEPRPETPEDPHGPFAGRYEPMPVVSKTVGLMIHVRDGRAVPYLVNLAAGWKSALRAAEQRDELAASKTPLGNPGAWAVLVQIDMPQPATGIVADAAARGPMGFSAPAGIASPADYRASADLSREQIVEQSVRGADGLVRWEPVQVDPNVRHLLAAIEDAADLPRLAELFDAAAAHGIEWSGAVASAAEARRQVIECPQRELHHGTGRCACGWAVTRRP